VYVNRSGPVDSGSGCGAGFWRQRQHFVYWPAPYQPSAPFAAYFDDAFPGKSLLTVLSQPSSAPPGPSQLNSLGRQAVAALLNAAALPGFPYSESQVIAAFNAALPQGPNAWVALAAELQELNEGNCPFPNLTPGVNGSPDLLDHLLEADAVLIGDPGPSVPQ
jgi:hypothetical protein